MRRVSLRFAIAAAVMVLGARRATADDLLGLYAGVAVGQSHVVAAGQVTVTPSLIYYDQGSFAENHAAFQVMAGIRPISMLGAELDYLDFGYPSGAFNGNSADVSMKGGAAFGVLYLPVPIVDIFLKAGIARIQSDIDGIAVFQTNCAGVRPCQQIAAIGPFALDRRNWSGAAGLGAQYKVGSLAMRAEYERFNAAGEHPSLLALGITWSF